ncbi:MAG: arylesterase [Amphritea sp.]
MGRLIGIWLIFLSSLAWGESLLVMGDSLSAAYGMPQQQGWVSLLQQRLNSEGYSYQVVNASISGETTHGGLSRLERQLEMHQPDLVIIALGANDGLRGTPLSLIEANLTRLVTQVKNSGSRVLLLEMRLPPNYGPQYAEGFTQLFSRVSQEQQVELLPFFLAPVVLQPELMQGDGLHPNARAQPVLLDQVWLRLQPLLNARPQSG